MTKKKLLDVAGGEYVEAVTLVDSGGYSINNTYPLSVKVENSTAIPVDVNGSGSTPLHIVSAATTNATSVKASAGKLTKIYAINTSATADRFVKVYNKATAPVVGTDVPVKTIKVTAASVADINLPSTSLTAGIAIAITGAVGDADATAIGAGDVILDIDYQ